MFIPTNNIKVGDRVKITKKFETLSGTFTVDHQFTVIGEGVRGLDLQDDDGNQLLETGLLHEFIKKIKS